MSWSRYLALSLAPQRVLHDHDVKLSRLARSHRGRDREQDERIAELEGEVLQLEAGVAALVNLLRDKRLATDEEIGHAVERATKAAEQALAAEAEAKQQAAAADAKALAARKLGSARARRRR